MNINIIKRKIKSAALLIIAGTFTVQSFTVATASAQTGQTGQNDLKERLEKLSARLEEGRKKNHIPGMAIAVVKDGKIIFARGYGVSDLEKNTPVTSKTLFGIGSISKSFTATLVGMVADDGKISLDEPITNYLPYFKLALANDTDQVTLRDMMAHRTGFTRLSLLFVNGTTTRDEILHAAVRAKPWTEFRKKFNYTNLMYLGAGVAAAKQAGTDWDQLLKKRILTPLKMNDTTSYYREALKNPNLSKGYIWQDDQNGHLNLKMHNMTNIAPAGSITSNVLDMAKWLKFQLSMGQVNKKRLISKKQIMEMRSPQMKINPAVSYGLGWMLSKWQGQPLVMHGGSVQGFNAQMAFLPQSNLGFILLTNVTASPLQNSSTHMVFDSILGKNISKTSSKEGKKVNYKEFTGDYVANFGPFNDVNFRFLITKDGRPAVDVPGQTTYELKDPDAEGKWYFAITDAIAISFDKDAKGGIKQMKMYQAGMTFILPPRTSKANTSEAKIEIPLEELQQYVGSYFSVKMNAAFQVKIQNNHLALDIPNQRVVELNIPDKNGHRTFRANTAFSVLLEANEKGKIETLSIFRDGKKQGSAVRVKESDKTVLPSINDIMTLRRTKQRTAALLKAENIRLEGKVIMLQSGVEGKITNSFIGFSHYRTDIDFGKYGKTSTAYSPAGAASVGITPYKEHLGKYLNQIRNDHPAADIDWRKFYKNINIIRTGKYKDKKGYNIKLSGGKTPDVLLFIDAKTGDVLRRRSKLMIPSMGQLPYTVTYEDYREIKGLRIPFKVTSRNNMVGETVITIKSIKKNVTFDPDLFTIKKPQ